MAANATVERIGKARIRMVDRKLGLLYCLKMCWFGGRLEMPLGDRRSARRYAAGAKSPRRRQSYQAPTSVTIGAGSAARCAIEKNWRAVRTRKKLYGVSTTK